MESAEPRESYTLWLIPAQKAAELSCNRSGNSQLSTTRTQTHTHRGEEGEKHDAGHTVKYYDVLHIGQDQTCVLNEEGLEFNASIPRPCHPFQGFITFPLMRFLQIHVGTGVLQTPARNSF